jgi:hypothetical protein
MASFLASISNAAPKANYFSETKTRVSGDVFSKILKKESGIEAGDSEKGILQFVAVLDPTSDVSQKIAGVLEVLKFYTLCCIYTNFL